MPEIIHPDPNAGSEFGGVPGLIQPAPHDPSNVSGEIRLLMMQTNPGGVVTADGLSFVQDPDDPVVPETQRLA
jgi:hypothetical protein